MLIQWALIKKRLWCGDDAGSQVHKFAASMEDPALCVLLAENILPGGTTADVECSYVMHLLKQPPAVNDDSQRMHQAIYSELSTRRPVLVVYECMPSSFDRSTRSWDKQIIGIGVWGPSQEKDQLVSATPPRIEHALQVNLHRLVSSTVA